MTANRTNAIRFTNDTATVNGMIDTLAKQGQTFQSNVQVVALSCIAALAKSRDTRVIPKLFGALPVGIRRKYLQNWFNMFNGTEDAGPAFGVDDKGAVQIAEIRSAEWIALVDNIDTILKSANEKKWYECKEDGTPKTFTFESVIETLRKKAKSKTIDATLQAKLEALIKAAEEIASLEA